MNKRRWLALLLIGVAGWQLEQGLRSYAPGATLSTQDVAPPSHATQALPSRIVASALAASAVASQPHARWLEQTSLRGTEPDGAWTVGPDGRLRADLALRRRLDHYLALQGEVPLDRLGALLAQQVAAQHGEAAAADLRLLWARYLTLQQQRWKTVADPGRPETLAAELAERIQVRRQLLGPAVAEAFYREEDDRLREAIARWNSSLGSTVATLAPTPQQHPPPLADAPWQQQLVQQGWSAWDQRLSDARSEQLRLQSDPGLSTLQREAAMTAYLEAQFSAAERPRVQAMLRLMPR